MRAWSTTSIDVKLCLVVLTFVAAACQLDEVVPNEQGGRVIANPNPVDDLIGAIEKEKLGENISLNQDMQLAPQRRSRGRLSVSQLESAISTVAGNDAQGEPIVWENPEDLSPEGTPLSFFSYNQIGKALGRSDNYRSVTYEDLSVSAVYIKFVGDMARDICTKINDADKTRVVTERIFLRPDVDPTLHSLTLRFWGKKTQEPEEIQDLRDVYLSVLDNTTPADTEMAWHTVCVALLSSSQFHIY
jgi:hypothetical protein